jgi:hypothetical protein
VSLFRVQVTCASFAGVVFDGVTGEKGMLETVATAVGVALGLERRRSPTTGELIHNAGAISVSITPVE